MSSPSYFGQRLSKALEPSPRSTPYMDSFKTLRETADELQKYLTSDSQSKELRVDVEPGFQSQMGQQLNVVLQIPSRGVRETLFRAYVPPSGTPVSLDFYGEQPVASGNVQEIQDNVLNFLAQPEVTSRINMYRELLKSDE